jgi:hypothetical protein
MTGFLYGWGVFWLLVWAVMFAVTWHADRIGLGSKNLYFWQGVSVIGAFLSLAWLAAVAVGQALS